MSRRQSCDRAVPAAISGLYAPHAIAPYAFGLTPLDDQRLAGLVMWVPAGRGEPLVDGDRRIGKCAQQVIDRIGKIERAGVGLPGAGAVAWWTSLEQAFRAIEHGQGSGACVSRYSHILLDEAIAHSDSTRQFLGAILDRLSVEPHLLETLQAYFQHKQHRKSVASALGVHPNTVDHRLQRIETLLSGDFNDVAWLATLSAALRLQRSDVAKER